MTATIDETSSRTTDQTTGTRVTSRVDVDKVRGERLVAAAQRRAAARTRDLTALLRERPDLAGVHAPADFAVDAVRWGA
jgi:hypothetical protein